MSTPRPEHPRPQFVRPDWLCLNGPWQFEIDAGDSGRERGLVERDLHSQILVPFCPESELSGIHETDFMPAVWYRRTVAVPEAWDGRRVLLHFQAVDYDTTVWVDGVELGRHRGGFTPFTVTLPRDAPGRTVALVVRARDDERTPQPRGKQSRAYANHSCLYTRTTGIWQTVWLEPVPQAALARPRITPDVANGCFHLEQRLDVTPGTSTRDLVLRATLRDGDGVVCARTCSAGLASRLVLPVSPERVRRWSPADPHLYDLEIELLDRDRVVDRATSYAGLRSVSIDGRAILLNGERVFQRLVLDQGYYPESIMTAPSDDALRRDIELSQAAGFNGARLHQKVFEERFLYHADRLGYLVWGEFPDWGCGGFGPDDDHQRPGPTYVAQWLEAIERDYSHPSIVGWCPLNETWQVLVDRTTMLDETSRALFLATKAADETRPVLDASGFSHRVPETDVYDCHDYEQDPAKFAANQAGLARGCPFVNTSGGRTMSLPYRGQPFFVSEFGGIWWNPEMASADLSERARQRLDSWGYGDRPCTIAEFYSRFEGLCGALLDDPHMFGYCYTQLTDVFQEQNGIYGFDRSAKFDCERLRTIQARPAAIERGAGDLDPRPS